MFTRELLDRFARHHRTNEPLPEALIDQGEGSGDVQPGIQDGRGVSAAILDLELHTRADGVFEPQGVRARDARAHRHAAEIALRHGLTHFDHLFGSDAVSGLYYSYLWADVMAADGWQAFLEASGPGMSSGARSAVLDGNISIAPRPTGISAAATRTWLRC